MLQFPKNQPWAYLMNQNEFSEKCLNLNCADPQVFKVHVSGEVLYKWECPSCGTEHTLNVSDGRNPRLTFGLSKNKKN